MATQKLSTKAETLEIKAKAKKPTLLFELAWEVCNQVGGIYTVIRSKVPAMVEQWGEDYCLIGPYVAASAIVEFEPIKVLDDSIFAKTVASMRAMGHEVHYGHWLVTGRPKIILFDFKPMIAQVDDLKFKLWENHLSVGHDVLFTLSGSFDGLDIAVVNTLHVVFFLSICKAFLIPLSITEVIALLEAIVIFSCVISVFDAVYGSFGFKKYERFIRGTRKKHK